MGQWLIPEQEMMDLVVATFDMVELFSNHIYFEYCRISIVCLGNYRIKHVHLCLLQS